MAGNWTAQFGAWTVGVVQVEGRNVGAGVPLYAQTVGEQFSVLEFKSLASGFGVELVDADGEITINSTLRSIDHLEIDGAGHLIVFYSDGSTQDLGQISAAGRFLAGSQPVGAIVSTGAAKLLASLRAAPGEFAYAGRDAALYVTPTNLTAPAISGSTASGSTLTGVAGVWSGE